MTGGVVAWVEGVSSTNAQGIQNTTITALKALSPSGMTITGHRPPQPFSLE